MSIVKALLNRIALSLNQEMGGGSQCICLSKNSHTSPLSLQLTQKSKTM